MSEPTVSRKTYRNTALALFVLLIATVGASFLPLGKAGPAVGLLIAAAKALLVVLYFMHVRYQSALVRLSTVVGVVWLSILFTLTLADYLTRPT